MGHQHSWRVEPEITTEERAKDKLAAWLKQSRTDPEKFWPECATGGHQTEAPVNEYAKRWLDHRAQAVVDIKTERQRMRDHVLPAFRNLRIQQVERKHVRRFVNFLDKKVEGGELAWKTANNCWVLARTMFKDACSSKIDELVIRNDDPTDKVLPPERGDDLERTYLYPSEFLKFITCKAVPVPWRRIYALAAYTFSRAGELKALRWDAIDLECGTIHFRQAMDPRKAGAKKSTKGRRNRRIPIEPNLRPLLEALFKEAKGPYVITSRFRNAPSRSASIRWWT